MDSDNDVSSYSKAFNEFKEYVKRINSEISDKIQHKGYLILLKQYFEFKEGLKNIQNQSAYKCHSQRNSKIKPIDTSDLMEQINNNYKYIIISNKLHQKICSSNYQNTHQIKYLITPSIITLITENGKILQFKNNKDNKIDKLSFIKIDNNSNYPIKENSEKIYNDIINYFKIEKDINEKLNNENIQVEKYMGFLVDKSWIDNWKKYSSYDKIKKELSINKNKSKDNMIERIKKEQENSNINYYDISNIENYIIKDMNALYSEENSDKSYALINQDFLYNFAPNINKRFIPTEFYLSYQNIEIRPHNKEPMSSHKNNIVSKNNYTSIGSITLKSSNKKKSNNSNNNNLYSSAYLKHLIKRFYFKKEFFSEDNKFQKQLTKAYLINKEIKNNLKEIFKINEIYQIMNKNPIFNDITYQNFYDGYPKILKLLNENQTDYINYIKQYGIKEAINFNKNEAALNYKYMYNNKKLIYIDDFEIIDDEFGNFLIKEFSHTFEIKPVHFAVLNKNYIILMMDNIYEIINFDSNSNYTPLYLIEFIHFNFKDFDLFQNYFYQFLMENNFEKLVSSGSPITTKNNDISFNILPISNTINQNNLTNSNNSYNGNNYINNTLNNLDNNLENEDINNKSKNENISEDKAYKNCYIISKKLSELISQSKNNINVNEYYNENQNQNGKLFNTLNFDLEKYKLKFGRIDIQQNNKRIFFPINFYVIDKAVLLRYQINNTNNIMEEVDLFYIHRGCFLISKNNNFNNEKNNLIFLYSIHENGKGKMYKPISIIECKNSNERYNAINSLIQISKGNNIIQNPKILEDNYNYTCYTIKHDNENDENSSKMNSSMNSQFNIINNSSLINEKAFNKNDESIIDFYLILAIQLKKEKDNLKKIFGQTFKPNSQIKNEYYLINKNYMNELNQIFNDINGKIDNCSEENEEKLLKILKSNLDNNTVKKINKLNKEKIQKQLNNNEMSGLKYSFANNEEKKRLCFYQNFDIISKKMLEIIKRIDVIIQNKIIKVNCIFDNNKIIMLLEEDLINIYFYYNTDETIVQYIIISKEAESLFKHLLIQGYVFLDKYLPYNKVKINVQYDTIEVIIYKLIKGNKIKLRMSDKLRTLLLVAYSNNILYDNNLHEVCLINPDWLDQYGYKTIEKLINNNYQKIANINIDYNKLKTICEISKYLDQHELMEFDDKLATITPNPSINFESSPKKLNLSNKYLLLFKEFVIVDKQIIL